MLIAPVAPVGFPASVRFLGSDRDYFIGHVHQVVRQLAATAHQGPLQILALSGGGAGGAFGAGALVGLSRRGERPQFQVVTGVSSGALLAPFAFLRPSWDRELMQAFDSDRAEHLLRPRGLALLFRPGFYQGAPLVELVDRFVSDRLIQAVAEQAASGRVLLVATTDLDKEEPVIWNMGAIAAHGGENARLLFRDVLVASASIPGIFPPLLIHVEGGGKSYDEMHADGGTTLPFFITSEIAEVEPEQLDELRGAKVFVIVNGQMNTYPETTRERPLAVLSRSFAAALMHDSRRTLELIAAFAQRYGMDFRFTNIPVSYAFQGPLDFKTPAVQTLFDYGERCAQTAQLWITLEQGIEEGQRAGTSPPRVSNDCPLTGAVP